MPDAVEAAVNQSPAVTGRRRATGMTPGDDQLRLITKVARMYHEQGMKQPQIAETLHISQPRVSRLLQQAGVLGIVRTIVVPPPGIFGDLEDEIQRRHRLRDVVVVDVAGNDTDVIPGLGAAAAIYLETTLTGGEQVGISSWSATLLATVKAMHPRPGRVVDSVVQLIGGVGNPNVQVQATRLTGRMAEITGADTCFMPAPGVVGTAAAREALSADPQVAEVMARWSQLTLAIVGIGSLEPSPLLRESGNVFGEEEQARLRELGAVGDICLRFFDEHGEHVRSEFDDRVLGIGPDQLRKIDRRIAVAGGNRKYAAIRAAILGGWIDVLITDVEVARRLAEEPSTR
jgi:DNA-binding transcriptional regulator LsrR (DeoR family)